MINKIDDAKAIMVCAKIREELVELISQYEGQLNTDSVRQCIQADIKQYFNKFSCRGYGLVDKNGQPLRPEHFVNERGEFCIPQEVHLATRCFDTTGEIMNGLDISFLHDTMERSV